MVCHPTQAKPKPVFATFQNQSYFTVKHVKLFFTKLETILTVSPYKLYTYTKSLIELSVLPPYPKKYNF